MFPHTYRAPLFYHTPDSVVKGYFCFFNVATVTPLQKGVWKCGRCLKNVTSFLKKSDSIFLKLFEVRFLSAYTHPLITNSRNWRITLKFGYRLIEHHRLRHTTITKRTKGARARRKTNYKGSTLGDPNEKIFYKTKSLK